MVSTSLYPLDAATMASPIPVFPEVGSTRTVFPGVMSPLCSASVIMERAMRSLTELAGLEDSSLATTSQTFPSVTLWSLTRGVWPISSRMFSAIFVSERAVVEVVAAFAFAFAFDTALTGVNALDWLRRPAAAMRRVDVLNFILMCIVVVTE